MQLIPVNKTKKLFPRNFINNHMKPRIPVIIEDFVDSESPAFKKWNYEYFKEIAGDQKVDIYGSEMDSMDRVASQPIAQTTFSEYLDLISSTPTEHRLFLFNLLNIKPELKDDIIYNDVTNGKILKWLPFMFLAVKVLLPGIILILICPMFSLHNLKELNGSGFSLGSNLT